MIKLGISLYPEQESFEEMKQYIELASKYNFTRIFSSLFSIPGDKNEIIEYFKKLCKLAHENNMEVCVDMTGEMFEKLGASECDLSVFKTIGIDEIRMDFCFGDERDKILVENKENIKIQFNAFMIDLVKAVNDKIQGCGLSVSHNFYPQKYTGESKKEFMRINQIWKDCNVKVAAFISSNTKQAHGPWPVYDGLPTVEDHRNRSVDYQVRDILAMGHVETIYFGNAFASEEEFKEANEVIMEYNIVEERTEFESLMSALLPNIGEKRIALKIDLENEVNDTEKEILFNFKKHGDLGNSNDYMLRSRVARMFYGKKSIPHRLVSKAFFTRGDVMIVNDNLKHYRGEIQICLKDMENDGQRNLVGHLNEDEMQLVEHIYPGVYFSFK